MKVKTIKVGLGLTAQPRSYEAFRIDIQLEAQLDEDDDANLAVSTLRKQVSRKLEQAVEEEIENFYGSTILAKILEMNNNGKLDAMVRRPGIS